MEVYLTSPLCGVHWHDNLFCRWHRPCKVDKFLIPLFFFAAIRNLGMFPNSNFWKLHSSTDCMGFLWEKIIADFKNWSVLRPTFFKCKCLCCDYLRNFLTPKCKKQVSSINIGGNKLVAVVFIFWYTNVWSFTLPTIFTKKAVKFFNKFSECVSIEGHISVAFPVYFLKGGIQFFWITCISILPAHISWPVRLMTPCLQAVQCHFQPKRKYLLSSETSEHEKIKWWLWLVLYITTLVARSYFRQIWLCAMPV